MDADEARGRVRAAGGPELLERLEALEASRGARAADGVPAGGPDRTPETLAAPDARTRPDFDVVIAGGGLSILHAPVLAARGLKVAVLDRARVALSHREWNASGPELAPLVEGGIVTAAALDALVVARYRHGLCRWHGGGSYPVQGVLDHAVDAAALLREARARAEALGVVLLDGHAVTATAEGPDAIVIRARVAGGAAPVELVARAVLDARGAASPWATADLVCPTVGGTMTGLAEGDAPDEIDPTVGDILATTDDVEDGRQHVWEAFPGRPGEVTVYLFHYALTEAVRPGALVELYGRFFSHLARYKRGAARMLRPTFGYIPGWSRLTPGPRAPGGRLVLVGDAAARHSPLTYCGFGSMLRTFVPLSEAVAAALGNGETPAAAVRRALPDEEIHGVTGALSRMMSAPAAERPHGLNALLDAAFATLHAMGNDAYAALLQDRLPAPQVLSFLLATAKSHPRVYREALSALGPGRALRWGARTLRRAATSRKSSAGPRKSP